MGETIRQSTPVYRKACGVCLKGPKYSLQADNGDLSHRLRAQTARQLAFAAELSR
jgi:hypothetical protein